MLPKSPLLLDLYFEPVRPLRLVMVMPRPRPHFYSEHSLHLQSTPADLVQRALPSPLPDPWQDQRFGPRLSHRILIF